MHLRGLKKHASEPFGKSKATPWDPVFRKMRKRTQNTKFLGPLLDPFSGLFWVRFLVTKNEEAIERFKKAFEDISDPSGLHFGHHFGDCGHELSRLCTSTKTCYLLHLSHFFPSRPNYETDFLGNPRLTSIHVPLRCRF